jgi:hypothetical protein
MLPVPLSFGAFPHLGKPPAFCNIYPNGHPNSNSKGYRNVFPNTNITI